MISESAKLQAHTIPKRAHAREFDIQGGTPATIDTFMNDTLHDLPTDRDMPYAFVALLAFWLAGCVHRGYEQLASIKDPPFPAVGHTPAAGLAAPTEIAPAPARPPTVINDFPCDCPDDRDARDRRCGGRSACLREGGVCRYAQDTPTLWRCFTRMRLVIAHLIGFLIRCRAGLASSAKRHRRDRWHSLLRDALTEINDCCGPCRTQGWIDVE